MITTYIKDQPNETELGRVWRAVSGAQGLGKAGLEEGPSASQEHEGKGQYVSDGPEGRPRPLVLNQQVRRSNESHLEAAF